MATASLGVEDQHAVCNEQGIDHKLTGMHDRAICAIEQR